MLTIEFKFHPPPDPLNATAPLLPLTILTHRNALDDTVLNLMQNHVSQRMASAKKDCPEWLPYLILPQEEDPHAFTSPQCVIRASINPFTHTSTGSRPTAGYYKLDPLQTLKDALRWKTFPEFPTIEVWEQFDGYLVDAAGSLTHEPTDTTLEGERRFKRQKLELVAGKKAMSSLLDGYGSDRSEEEEEVAPVDGMAALGAYDETDSDDNGISPEEHDDIDWDESDEDG